MYDDTGAVLGASASAIILPATASALTGVNYFILLGLALAVIAFYNISIKIIEKIIKTK